MRKRLSALSHFLHAYFIWFLLGSYVVAALLPGPGLWIRSVSFGAIAAFGQKTTVSLPVLMLAFLILNAGLGTQTRELNKLLHAPLPLLVGLVANVLAPILYIVAIAQTLRLWHNPDEVQNILVGLALVASMPIAGSSTAWSQNANGNLALSLGLVLLSTFLSPVTTPVALHSVGWLAAGDYAEDLHELAAGGAGGFLAISVLLPSLLGITVQRTAGDARIAAVRPLLKLANSVNLLLLNYSNASLSLPQVLADPDWDFLAVILGIVLCLCLFSFVAGWLIARLLKTDFSDKISLMFGLGMNNNGTGLVLASLALADHPRVLLPIIFYNLVQHLVAGCVDFALSRKESPDVQVPGSQGPPGKNE